MLIGNERRVGRLRSLVNDSKLVRIVEVHNPASAIIAEAAEYNGARFDGFWSSSLTDSASRGMPDVEILDARHRVSQIDEILAATTLPLVVDLDTGGPIEHLSRAIRLMERAGVSAVCIEDKCGAKVNSLVE